MSRGLACNTSREQALYERGYPYLATLVDGHKDDRKPAAAAVRVFKDYWGAYHAEWPRLVAQAFVRASAEVVGGQWDGPEAAKAAASQEPVDAAQARAFVQAWLGKRFRSGFYVTSSVVFAIEAVTGTDRTLRAIVEELEALPEARWDAVDTNRGGSDEHPSLMAYVTGFLLLRASDAARAELRPRLEALYDATVKASVAPGEHTLRGGLDLALHGDEGARRTLVQSHWQYWYYYLHVEDPAIHLTRLADTSKSEWVPEARVLWLAGEELLPVYTTKKALRQGKRLPSILRDFGMLAHERVFTLMVEMVASKSAGTAPAEYFRANAVAVRPKLERLARVAGPLMANAKAALESF